MKLSILIVNWNSKEYLKSCLNSIRRTCDHLAPQLVVVDGGSFDGCDQMISSDYPDVEFVQSQENIGFGRSNNLGFERVAGDHLLLLNPDTELLPGAVDAMLSALQDPETGLVGARLLNSDGSLQLSSVHPLPTPWNASIDSEWVRQRWWKNKENVQTPFQVEAVSGACMMMRSETFRGLNGFDPRYFMYAEDMDLCFRIGRSGLKILHSPSAQVIHHGGGSSKTTFSKFSVVMVREAVAHYMLYNHGRGQMVLHRLLVGISAMARLLLLFTKWMTMNPNSRHLLANGITKWRTVLRWSIYQEQIAQRIWREKSSPADHAGTSFFNFESTTHR